MRDQDQIDYSSMHCYWSLGLASENRPTLKGTGGTLEEVLCVHEGLGPCEGDGWQMHVELSDIHSFHRNPTEACGVFLRDVARAISVALAEQYDMTREQAEAIIERGFNSGYTYLPMKKQGEPSTNEVEKAVN